MSFLSLHSEYIEGCNSKSFLLWKYQKVLFVARPFIEEFLNNSFLNNTIEK